MKARLFIALVCAIAVAQSARAEFLARITVVATDLGGAPLVSVAVGQEFLLQSIVQDIRDPPPQLGSGTFAAYLNASFDAGLAEFSPGASLELSPFFNLVRTGDLTTPGIVSGAGAAMSSLSPPGNAPQPLWNVPLTAIAPGEVSFTPTFDTLTGHDVLLYLLNEPIPESQIDFIGSTLTIVPEPSTVVIAGTGCSALALLAVRRGRHAGRRARIASKRPIAS